MRGKVSNPPFTNKRKRITPAHAGKRTMSSTLLSFLQDHPRTCGEKFFRTANHYRREGSPPHMRGKAISIRLSISLSRITPAHAGKRGFGCY